ncbi:MAG: DUF2620 family protein [Lachnospiraceae bacterium]|jgi:hypothetical protein|nr:DUF2620 family protein [Lachnospiraceae bacterium]MCI9681482.1 DUF2620 family protein [Lachnospiraceae bacterium]
MKIAIGGMQKNQMQQEIARVCPEVETVITNDMNAASMLKKGEADYYIGACESGGGSAIAILIGLMGYNKCCTVCKNGGDPKREEMEKFVAEGKLCFGMTVSQIENTVPILMQVLTEHENRT